MKIDAQPHSSTENKKKQKEQPKALPKEKRKKNKKQKTEKESPIQEKKMQIKPQDLMNSTSVPRGDVSTRLAVLNIDWESIGANEIYRVIKVFLSAENIKKVTIYKTKLGKRELEKEEKEGPAVLKLDEDLGTTDSDIREYLKKKMKYFYAVIEVDTEEKAKELYAAIDGLEIEDTHNYIDARFIPADAPINDEVVEETTEMSKNIRKIPINPLYSTKPQLKWDEDPVRDRYLRDLFDKDFDMDVANDLIDASDDEEKQAYYKKIMMPETEETEPENKPAKKNTKEKKEAKTADKAVDDEDIRMEVSNDSQEEESSEVVILGEDDRFAKGNNNPDFTVDVTHPAYVAKQKNKNKK
ncbi:hypothetical protein NEMIN01_2055 [Nematocida minor]|uniref:uncharacterized protein n=1 Tax=Nematocida minor TaxID=1912983 RepID=UPI00221FE22A|nr:uncharacterized protein NEMIN01_2055 [Nematocida minor]KAI5192504.1 hypothetical protein NEMIN01_2055 [Nematocida minor]